MSSLKDEEENFLFFFVSSKDSKEAKNKLVNNKWKISKSNINFIKLIEDDLTRLNENYYFLTEIQAKSILEFSENIF